MLKSNHKRENLGRGLSALLGEDDFAFDDGASVYEAKEKVKKIPLFRLKPSAYQPRLDFDEEALNALAASIKEKGVLQPLLVRRQNDGNYEIIAGERRFRAAGLAGLAEVPVIIKEMSDGEVLEVALIENILRENLSAIEEAEGFQRLIDEFSHTQENLSEIIGKSRSYVANTLRLLSLPESVKQLVRENKLSAGHVRPLIGRDDAETLALKIMEKDLNVRQVEAMIKKIKTVSLNPAEKKIASRHNQDIADLESGLSSKLGLKIKITMSAKGSGAIVLNYGDLGELDRIIDILSRNDNKK